MDTPFPLNHLTSLNLQIKLTRKMRHNRNLQQTHLNHIKEVPLHVKLQSRTTQWWRWDGKKKVGCGKEKKGKELDNFKTRFYYFYLVRFAYMPLLLFIPIPCMWFEHCSRLMGFFHRSDHGKFFFLFSYNKQLTWKHPHLNFYLVSFLLRIFEISFLFCFFTLWIFDLERCMHVNEYFLWAKGFFAAAFIYKFINN